ncbi:LuxR C-terminal-related transcriptional regulator [Massilia cavernae]|uniref:Helix-turn-helix transcriptional regulator n=1 Tax=Massilia cavernae TaxID=2320864 RepID=A0A418Y0S3_9BURK|nr:LuxR C-terminal-related transcriptional regulator [Massilia cavernae]RJG18915.1 helix-turn-helix transcriptional regulator [Massilia cavernae]
MQSVSSTAFFASKISPPGIPAEQVLRPTLCKQICHASAAKLVLVRAPAGFGKTSAMAEARAQLEQSGVDTAWLTLDRADNDPSRFLAGLAVATRHLKPDPDAPLAPLDTIALLASHSSPFVLFVDEFEIIREPAVLNLVREIIAHLPRRSKIVLGSRSLPDLGLGRLRAQGQLMEIDTEHLRFTLAETNDFFRLRQQEPLPAEALSRLHGKTEGWVAALWLASLSLARRGADSDFIDRFSGTNRAVADYLAEDVLSQQPEEIRDFLLRTSILRNLNPSLCQALNPHQNTDGILARLEAASLFLVPIATEENTYRYHSLFSTFLRARLAQERPDELCRLHQAAMEWYQAHGRPVPAIDHAIEAGDYPRALELLSLHANGFLEQGRMHLLARWFAVIPETLLRDYPLLQIAAVWAACFARGPQEAMDLLERSGCTRSTDPVIVANVNALRPLLLNLMDRFEDAYSAGRDSLSRLPSADPFADAVLTNAMAYIVAAMGEHKEAHRLLDVSRHLLGNSFFNRMYSDAVEGMLDLHQGRLRQASARFRMALSATHSSSHTLASGNALAGVLYADTRYEANDLAQAEHLLNVHLPMARDVGMPDHMISCHLMLARIAFTRGDIDQAFEQLIKLEYLGQRRQLPRVLASARLERSRLLLLQGNARASREELVRADDRAVWDRVRPTQFPHDLEYIELGQLRWEVSFGDAAAAAPRLLQAIKNARSLELHRRALKLQVLYSLALARTNSPLAVETMQDVLHQACEEGFMRLILDEGMALAPLVHKVHARVTDQQGRQADPIFLEYLQRLLDVLGPCIGMPELVPAEMLEPLTRKEERVLHLLADGYSNSAIAEKLFVSDSTVRTHLRNINMKLNANSRTQAVAIARRLQLIR